MDNGKPIRESRDIDIPLVARHFYHHAGWAQHLDREFPDHVPYGVCGQIIPWNFPLLMLAWKIAPGARRRQHGGAEARRVHLAHRAAVRRDLREGRPAARASSTSSPGEGDTGAAIVNHPDIDKIAFTGSTEVGKIIRTATAGTGKGLSLELGGKSPYIVFEDADLDSAIEGLVDAIWFNQGQVCCAGSRLLVQESIEDALHRQAQEAHVDAPRRRSARQGHRHRRAGRARAGRAHPRPDEERRRRRRPSSTSPISTCPSRRLLPQARADHQRLARQHRWSPRKSSGRCSSP